MKKTLLVLLVIFSFNSIFAQLTATFNVTPITCNTPTGVIMINPTGGVAPYQFSINNGVTFQANNIFVNLPPGAYNVMVKDNTGAVLNQFIAMNPLIPLTVNINVSNITCNGASNGVIMAATTGGQAPYVYTLHSGSTVVGPVASSVFSGLPAGTYSIDVRDAGGCITASPTVTITEPILLVCNSVVGSNSITVSATGGTGPYSYSIDGVSYQANGTFGSLPPGNYTTQVKDAYGCICSSNATVINSGFSANITSTLDNPISTLSANPAGGTAPYTYQWGLNGATISGANNPTLNILGMCGTFNLTVTDANNFTATATNYFCSSIPLYANDDALTVYPINAGNAVSSISVLSNDMLNGLPVNSPGNAVTLSPLSVPAGFLLNTNGTVSVLSGTASGTYTLTYQICSVASPAFCDPGTVTITVVNKGIQLNAFIDTNNNGVKDAGESIFTQGQFGYELNSSGTVNYVTSSSGSYFINENNPANSYHLTYTIDSVYLTQYSETVSYSNITVPSGVVVYDFPVTELPFKDLAVNIYQSGAPPRPGFVYSNAVIYKNNGNQTIASGTVTFTKDNAVTITNVSQSGITNTATGFTYNFTNLLPREVRIFYVTMQVPAIPTVALGQALTNSASATIPAGDINTLNNNATLTQVIVGSYDPNDKTESHGGKIVHATFTSNDYLTYTIQFENTGTANAENVRVNDVLDSKLDETSVKMIDASHGYTLNRVGNTLNWNFNGIHLPASGGKGYINFQVKPKAGYAVGDIIPNKANIYFDFNPAIITNTFNTEFVTSLSAAQFTNTSFVAYPNPTNGQLTIALKNNTNTIDIVTVNDVLGKTVQTNVIHNATAVLDLSNLSRGIYFVKVKSEGEEKVMKIVKE